MSARQNSPESAGPGGAQPATVVPGAPTSAASSHWRQERLTEARGVLADIAHQPDTLVVLACRVVCGCSPDAEERTDALGVMRLLDGRPQEIASAAPKGGAA